MIRERDDQNFDLLHLTQTEKMGAKISQLVDNDIPDYQQQIYQKQPIYVINNNYNIENLNIALRQSSLKENDKGNISESGAETGNRNLDSKFKFPEITVAQNTLD